MRPKRQRKAGGANHNSQKPGGDVPGSEPDRKIADACVALPSQKTLRGSAEPEEVASDLTERARRNSAAIPPVRTHAVHRAISIMRRKGAQSVHESCLSL